MNIVAAFTVNIHKTYKNIVTLSVDSDVVHRLTELAHSANLSGSETCCLHYAFVAVCLEFF